MAHVTVYLLVLDPFAGTRIPLLPSVQQSSATSTSELIRDGKLDKQGEGQRTGNFRLQLPDLYLVRIDAQIHPGGVYRLAECDS
jgi:hypothetical protein